jgi:hypothetical protein
MLHTQLAAVALTGLVLVASGCGKSSKTESTSTAAATTTPATTTTTTTESTTTTAATGKPLSRTELIAAADAICARSNAKTSVLFAKQIQELATIYPEIALYEGTETKELGQLTPPSSMTVAWKRIINDIEQHRRYVTEVAHDIQIKSTNAGRPYHLATVAIEDELVTAKHAGFKRCSISS